MSCQAIPTICGACLCMQGFMDLEMILLPLMFLVSTNFVYLSFIVSPPFNCQACIQFPLSCSSSSRSCHEKDISTHQSGGVKDRPDTHKANINVDCLIIGAGLGGVCLLRHLRKAGYSCKIFEAGSDLGEIWHWELLPRRPSRFAGSCLRILKTRGVEELDLDGDLPGVARTRGLFRPQGIRHQERGTIRDACHRSRL